MPAAPVGDYLVTLTIPSVDLVAKDATQHAFAFHVATPTLTVGLIGMATDFFNHTPTGAAHPIAYWMANACTRVTNGCVAKCYNISGELGVGAFHGTPIDIETWTLGPVTTVNADLPAQNCIVLATNATASGILEHGPTEIIPSTEAAVDQGAPETHTGRSRPLSRTRGRMFLGPWNLTAITSPGNAIANDVKLAVCNAAVDLVAASAAAAAPWSVWSKVDAVLRPIAHGYCETKFGTQRRRREYQPPRIPWP